MAQTQFLRYSKRLNKSTEELAVLLGVSEDEIRNYQEGTTVVPWFIERKLFYLLSRMRSEDLSRMPCWTLKACPLERKQSCPAWEYQTGAACWMINGTNCEETQNLNDQEKWTVCKKCEVITSIASPPKRDPLEKADLKLQEEVISQFEQIVGKDPKMQVVYRLIEDVAVTNTTVMIQGESGTGKELVARAIHRQSPRRDKPFVVINCSAFPESLLESELFGYEKGAFTGANKTWAGRFEQADGGTVFLDEIGDISPQAQVKLLRVLQTQKIKRLGGDQIITVDIRVITASNKNLKDLVQEQKFRADLFYRLNVIPIYLPALREKRNDIPLLAVHFLQRFAADFGKDVFDFSPAAMRRLLSYSWPGNTRELQHCIEYAVALCKTKRIEVENLPFDNQEVESSTVGDADQKLETVEKKHILQVMKSVAGNKKEAAQKLGISRSTLYEKIKRYGIDSSLEEN